MAVHPRLLRLPLLTLAAAWLTATAAHAQFAMVPSPLPPVLQPSQAESDQDYRAEAAKHIYASYPMRIYKGRMPPLLYGVAIVETEIDAEGKLIDVRIRRPPAAPEVGPWIVQMIRKAAPFPPPAKMGKAIYQDIWLVHKGGNFQLDTLTEGQN
ncbi:energy transducer TonB family protein [Aquabacterium sp. OR-4]|uniref:energy transducer TonB family protein n=1 Tax=Aquabacterium sp. OR-4 TaxID=2978127 RepID=UPI0021B1BAF1|nr:energy transducer TonB [Aquabacterium sp. OR-4]MDT7834039.1 energy transducer TonB [Aquabacterium sp. OR-4]